MCEICEKYKSGQIDGEKALDLMNDKVELETRANKKEALTRHLFELSELILAKEVPMPEVDEDADRDWCNATLGSDQ